MGALTDSRGRPRVVVTGMGVVSPLAVGLDETWAAIKAGKSGIANITLLPRDADESDQRREAS